MSTVISLNVASMFFMCAHSTLSYLKFTSNTINLIYELIGTQAAHCASSLVRLLVKP